MEIGRQYQDCLDQSRVLEPLLLDGLMVKCRVYFKSNRGLESAGTIKLHSKMFDKSNKSGYHPYNPNAKPPQKKGKQIIPIFEGNPDLDQLRSFDDE